MFLSCLEKLCNKPDLQRSFSKAQKSDSIYEHMKGMQTHFHL